ncbi:MAG: CapA family protein [Oscillospiraceae bacterium]|jgi:poly-gamma-glutamate synthesis protein (capsule biosynthesis protein)|nr:CapA family protein [Oscillospiraceae bacterium]
MADTVIMSEGVRKVGKAVKTTNPRKGKNESGKRICGVLIFTAVIAAGLIWGIFRVGFPNAESGEVTDRDWYQPENDGNGYWRASPLWNPDKKAIVLRLGGSDKITGAFNGGEARLEWKTADGKIAKVSKDGAVSAVKKGGTYAIAYHEGEKVLMVPIFVERDDPPPLGEIPQRRFALENGVYTNKALNNKKNQATLMFAGDIMFLSEQQRHAMTDGGAFDFNASFEYVKPILEKADFVAGTLETVVTAKHPYKWEQTRTANERGPVPNCNAPATCLDALRYAGFDAVATANNHCLDSGIKGIEETTGNLDRYNILHTGVFNSADEQRYLIVDVNGIKAAVFAYTVFFNGWESYLTPEETETYTNYYDSDGKERLRSNIEDAKSKGADFVIVFMHWGTQNSSVTSDSQIRRAREIADAGADYIIGSHTHVLQRYEVLTSAEGKKVPVIYSMGNFVSSMDQAEDKKNRDAVILKIDLTKDENGGITAEDSYIPLFSVREFGSGRYVTVPCQEELNGGYTSRDLRDSQKRIEEALGGGLRKANAAKPD